jgi:hypothetical protein
MRNGLLTIFFLFVSSNGIFAKAIPLFDNKFEFHKFHVSKCQIEFNFPEKALQISMHIFIDDLEEALRNQGFGKLFIGTEKESDQADEYLLQYLNDHFILNVNDQNVEYEFIGKETSEDLQAIWCYLEITNIETVESLAVENSLLMEVFADQKNIIHIMMPNKKQGYFMLEKGKSSDKAIFR